MPITLLDHSYRRFAPLSWVPITAGKVETTFTAPIMGHHQLGSSVIPCRQGFVSEFGLATTLELDFSRPEHGPMW